jgi:hypothetical protein
MEEHCIAWRYNFVHQSAWEVLVLSAWSIIQAFKGTTIQVRYGLSHTQIFSNRTVIVTNQSFAFHICMSSTLAVALHDPERLSEIGLSVSHHMFCDKSGKSKQQQGMVTHKQ